LVHADVFRYGDRQDIGQLLQAAADVIEERVAAKEFHIAWDYAGRTFTPNSFHPERLTVDPDDPTWLEVYAGLGARQRQALDFIRTLPGHTTAFFLSSYALGERLDISQGEAWKILRSLQQRGILECLAGYPPGHSQFRKQANEYRVSCFDREDDPFVITD
jgi:hypothetical protein